jgi:hypothetical protein
VEQFLKATKIIGWTHPLVASKAGASAVQQLGSGLSVNSKGPPGSENLPEFALRGTNVLTPTY